MSQSIGQSLARIERHISKKCRLDREMMVFNNLSINEYHYLQTANELKLARLSDLSLELGVSIPSASNMAKKLEKKGYLKRKQNTEDGRSILLSLTDKGRHLINCEIKLFLQLTKKIKRSLSGDDYIKLEQLLIDVCKSL